MMFLYFALFNLTLLLVDYYRYWLPTVRKLSTKKIKNVSISVSESHLEKKATYDLRHSVIGKKINLQTAMALLFIKNGTVEENMITYLNSVSREIVYIFDETKDETTFVSEFIIFRHKNRNQVAVYKIVPFVFTLGAGYTVESEQDFWKRDFTKKLSEGYARYRAYRIIKKNTGAAFHHWLNGGKLRDGRYGIRPSIDAKFLDTLGLFSPELDV